MSERQHFPLLVEGTTYLIPKATLHLTFTKTVCSNLTVINYNRSYHAHDGID